MKRWGLLGLVVVLLFVWVVPVTADQLQDAKKQQNQLKNKASTLEKQKSDAKNKLNQVQKDKNALANAQQQENKELVEMVNQKKALDKEEADAEAALEEAEQKYSDQRELFKTRLKVMYENSNNSSYLKTIVESNNLSDLLAKLKYISLISKRDKEIMGSLDTAKKDVEIKKQQKIAQVEKKQQQIKDQQVLLNKIKTSRAAKEQLEKEIQSKVKQLEKQIDDANDEAEALASVIRNLARSKGKYEGTMQWPAPGYSGISSPYGWRMHPILGKQKFHSGVDINAPQGASIVAANKGTVVLAGWQSGYGNTVVIDHGGGITTLYGHCSRLLVGEGDSVKAGQVIAKVGSTGLSTGPHLHFEVRKDGDTTNPLNYASP